MFSVDNKRGSGEIGSWILFELFFFEILWQKKKISTIYYLPFIKWKELKIFRKEKYPFALHFIYYFTLITTTDK